MQSISMICKLKFLTGVILLILPFTLRAQCNGSWTTGSTLNYLCADGSFLQYDLGANICPSAAQSVFTFSSPVQNIKLIFSAFGTSGQYRKSRMSVFLNNNIIDLNLACNIILGCQTPVGKYSINNGCLVDSVNGYDGGISGFIYFKAASFGLPYITSIGFAVSEPGASGTIFQLDSCYIDDNFECTTTGISESSESENILYPNPFTNNLTIINKGNEIAEFILYDMYLRKVLENIFLKSLLINTESLYNGIYFYEVRSKNGASTKGKVIKQ
jgi:hypothetical protein